MKKFSKMLLKGTIISLIINVIANYITFHSAQWVNVVVGTILGLIVYVITEKIK